MPPFLWVRAATWKLYDTGVSMKQVGDQALRMETYDLAFAKYENCQNVFKTAQANNENLSGIEYAEFNGSSDRLISNCETNILLSTLNAGEDPKEQEMTALEAANFVLRSDATQNIEATDRVTQLSGLEKSRHHHYRAIAYAIKGDDNAAFIRLLKAA